MNSKETVTFSTLAIATVALLFASIPIIGNQASAYGPYGYPGYGRHVDGRGVPLIHHCGTCTVYTTSSVATTYTCLAIYTAASSTITYAPASTCHLAGCPRAVQHATPSTNTPYLHNYIRPHSTCLLKAMLHTPNMG